MIDIPEKLRHCLHMAQCSLPSPEGEFERRLTKEMDEVGYKLPNNLLLSFEYMDVTRYDSPEKKLYIVAMVHLEERKTG